MPDAWEVRFGLNPTHGDAHQDPDGDGAANVADYTTGTDPTDSLSVVISSRCSGDLGPLA
jgi:hypothetical protein